MWLDDAGRDHSLGLGLIFVDLNRFKQINDTFGHDAGDDLLVSVAHRISALIHAGDVVARVGDEFIIASNNSHSVVEDVADRVRHAIADTSFQIHNQAVTMSASVGVSHMSHQPDFSALLYDADHAMYHAKKSLGRTVQRDDRCIQPGLCGSSVRVARRVDSIARVHEGDGSMSEMATGRPLRRLFESAARVLSSLKAT